MRLPRRRRRRLRAGRSPSSTGTADGAGADGIVAGPLHVLARAEIILPATDNVEVPVKMQEADKEDAILIAITRDGKVFLSPGNSLIQIDKLPDKVKELQTNRSDKTVYIKADARARFEVMENVIDSLRTVGVDQLGLLTEQIQSDRRNQPDL